MTGALGVQGWKEARSLLHRWWRERHFLPIHVREARLHIGGACLPAHGHQG